jgi:hypothetical protein
MRLYAESKGETRNAYAIVGTKYKGRDYFGNLQLDGSITVEGTELSGMLL